MMDLTSMPLIPITGKEPSLDDQQISELTQQIPNWKVIEQNGEKEITRSYKFPNFASALTFTNRIGALAEDNDHHPAILTEWGKVTVSWWTHKIHGLHQNDFIMAARTDLAYQQMPR